MAFCPACRAFVRDSESRCPECLEPVKKKERPRYDPAEARERWWQENLRTAEHERRKFGLLPRQPGESDAAFIKRIDVEKTIVMSKSREREPGEEG
jgi:hypothetical protein